MLFISIFVIPKLVEKFNFIYSNGLSIILP